MCDLIQTIWPEKETVSAIVVASPGPVDPERGIIFSAPNIPGWENFPLADRLNERLRVPVFLGNDANLAALGEWKFGAGRGHRHLLYLTISTGIGGGIISDNQLLLGARGLAGELGHIPILPDGPVCGCGQAGHLEALASGPAIAEYVKEKLRQGAVSSLQPDPKITAADIGEAALAGDVLAMEAYLRAGKFIGQALAGFLHIFNPSVVIFGGGVSFSGSLLLDPVRESLEKYVMDPGYLEGLTITTAELGDDAGLYGALALALSHLESI